MSSHEEDVARKLMGKKTDREIIKELERKIDNLESWLGHLQDSLDSLYKIVGNAMR